MKFPVDVEGVTKEDRKSGKSIILLLLKSV